MVGPKWELYLVSMDYPCTCQYFILACPQISTSWVYTDFKMLNYFFSKIRSKECCTEEQSSTSTFAKTCFQFIRDFNCFHRHKLWSSESFHLNSGLSKCSETCGFNDTASCFVPTICP